MIQTAMLLRYLSALRENNNREWYHAHKTEYQEAAAQFEALVQTLILRIGEEDPSILRNTPKELTFKLVRDTRFSRDKSPYLPAFRAHIGPQGKIPIPVGYYLMIQPGNQSFLGGGLFADMFQSATTMIRDAITARPDDWERVITADDFRETFTVQGAKLKNVPRGYEKTAPQAEFLKHKSWYLEYPVADHQLENGDEFLALAVRIFLKMRPFHAFLNGALAGFQMPPR